MWARLKRAAFWYFLPPLRCWVLGAQKRRVRKARQHWLALREGGSGVSYFLWKWNHCRASFSLCARRGTGGHNRALLLFIPAPSCSSCVRILFVITWGKTSLSVGIHCVVWLTLLHKHTAEYITEVFSCLGRSTQNHFLLKSLKSKGKSISDKGVPAWPKISHGEPDTHPHSPLFYSTYPHTTNLRAPLPIQV